MDDSIASGGSEPVTAGLDRAIASGGAYSDFLARLRRADPVFAEASILQDEHMGEWQAAVYLLTGCDALWRQLGGAVLEARNIAPVLEEIENSGRAWSASEAETMAWAAHFWDQHRYPASFPYVFERFLFNRWITALHLRRGLSPQLPTG